MNVRRWSFFLLVGLLSLLTFPVRLAAQTQPVLAVSITGIDTDISLNTNTVGPDGILDTDLGTDTKQVQRFNADGTPVTDANGELVYDTVLDPDFDLDLYDAYSGNDYISPPNELSNVYGRTINIRALAVGFFPESGFTYEFFINNQSIGKPANPAAGNPGVLSWTPPQPGVYYIRVQASGNGITAQSLAVRYFATGAAISSPLPNTLVPSGSSVVLTADATGASGFVKHVQFYVNGVAQGDPDGTYPYSIVFKATGASGAVYNITAVATDNDNTALPVSDVVAIRTVAAIGDLPTVSITSPSVTSGGSEAIVAYPTGSNTIPITVQANDSDGRVNKVEIYIDGVLAVSDSAFPYSYDWSPTAVGSYNIIALVYDDKNNVVSSSDSGGPRKVKVTAPPTVTITKPSASATITAAIPYTIEVDASDSDGSVGSVQVFVDNESVGVATETTAGSGHYTVSWTPVQKSDEEPTVISAIATDDLGIQTVSASVSVSVIGEGDGGGTVIGAVPTVTLTSPANGDAFIVNNSVILLANASDSDGSIVKVQFYVDGAAQGAADSVFPYQAEWVPTSPGTYKISARATDNDGNTVASDKVGGVTVNTVVTVTASSTGLPAVRVVSPATNVTSAVEDTMAIVALASDPDGSVSRVEFYVNGTSLGGVTASPYVMRWTPLTSGIYQVTAAVTDDGGNRVVSSVVSVNVVAVNGALPIATVDFNAPDEDVGTDTSARSWTTPYAVSYFSKLLISANAVDVDGSIARVDFYANGQLIASDTTAPYYTVWTLNTLNDVAITAVAVDSSGNPYHTFPILIDTQLASASAAAVTLNSPVNGGSYTAGGQILFNASTTFGNQPEPKVDFYVNGSQFLTTTTEPFQQSMGLTIPGTYDVHAVVRAGTRTTVSSVARIQVLSNGAPTVALTAPSNGGTYTLGSSLTLSATASDADGTVTSVEFFANGVSIGSDTTSPYTTTYTPVAEGTYRLTAVATDNSQAATTSTASTVLFVPTSAISSNSVYRGSYTVGTDTFQFSALNAHGLSGLFIGHTAVGAATPKIYFYSSFEFTATSQYQASFHATGTMNSTASVLDGVFSTTHVQATLDSKTFPLVIGTVSMAGATSYPSGVYMGSLVDSSASQLVAILGPDGTLALYAANGSARNAGSGVVTSSGSVQFSLAAGGSFSGKVDFTGGLLSGTITGGPVSGTISAALTTGSSFSDGALRGVSTRGLVGSGERVLIAGFSINGTLAKSIVIRAIGPSLASLGVSNPVADPVLELYDVAGGLVASNDNWATPSAAAPAVVSASRAAGLFALNNNSLDAVLYKSLTPGTYTAMVKSKGDDGVALVEVYDGDAAESFSTQKVIAISTRGWVGTGEGMLISGFAVSGSSAKKVLIRAVGPTLGSFGVSGVLLDPKIKLERLTASATTLVRENDNWETGNDRALVSEAASRSFLFPLVAGSKDAAILLSLPPGNYSATVSGASAGTGVVLMEVYEVP